MTVNDYWQWLQESFVNRIAVERWYNGQVDNTSAGYLSDRTNRLIGWATMRQLRIKSGERVFKLLVLTDGKIVLSSNVIRLADKIESIFHILTPIVTVQRSSHSKIHSSAQTYTLRRGNI
jgi:hypothetical protein